MYRSFLLVIGCMFLSFALLGTGYLFILGRPDELRGLINLGGVTSQPGSTEEPVAGATEPVPSAEPTGTPAPDTPTPRPAPTFTPSRTQPTFNMLTFCVNSLSARTFIVRSGPGTGYPPLGKPLPVGTCLAFGARNEESTWLQIAPDQPEWTLQPYEGGWIARELLGLGSTGPIDLPAVTLTPTPQPKILGLVTPAFTPTRLVTLNDASFPILYFKPGASHLASGMSGPDHAAPSDNFMVEAEWPARMEVDGSGTIRVSLVRTSAGYVPTVEIAGNTAVVFTPIPVGTPGQDLGSAFGEDYVAKSAVARIAGASFDIQPALPSESQMLEQPQIVWTWNISSDTPAKNQALDVTIQIEWQRVGHEEDIKSPVIWRDHIEIDVFQTPIKAGQVSALSLFSAFLGSGLSIPWLYERISKRKSQGRKKPKKRS